MPLVLADVGADQILKAYFNNSWPTSKNLKLKLYSNNYTPVQTSTHANFTEVTGGGYAAITLTNGSWTVTVGNDPSDAVYAEQTFTFTGTIGGSGIVYGYYIVDDDGSGSNVLIYAELFGTSFTPANNGDNIKLTPKFQLSSGTPA
jgi:hypothetical protein